MGTIMLKFKRPSLPREVTVSYKTAIFGTICVSLKIGKITKRMFRPFIEQGSVCIPRAYGERARVYSSVGQLTCRVPWIVLFMEHEVHWLSYCSFCSSSGKRPGVVQDHSITKDMLKDKYSYGFWNST